MATMRSPERSRRLFDTSSPTPLLSSDSYVDSYGSVHNYSSGSSSKSARGVRLACQHQQRRRLRGRQQLIKRTTL